MEPTSFEDLAGSPEETALQRLSDRLGVSRNQVIRMAINRLYDQFFPEEVSHDMPTAEELKEIGLTPAGLARYGVSQVFRSTGCPACARHGYRGRTGIYELLAVDDALRRLIHDRSSEQALRDHATAQGMRSLREDGMRWAGQGVISLEEVVRVTGE